MPDRLHSTYQWHDQFDKAFGATASDCCDLLDWPGKTAPFQESRIEAMMSGGPVDWDAMNKFRGQVKFDVYKKELIAANPELAPFEGATIVFLMRSTGEARLIRDIDEGVIIADALWLSFASFCAQSLLSTFPQPDEPDAEQVRLQVTVHFAMRALLYQEILCGHAVDHERFKIIWDSWPTRAEGGPGELTFLWTGLGRFVVAHEMGHILHHAPQNCTVEAARRRGILPAQWIEPLPDSSSPVEDYLFEVEADMEALRMCAAMLIDHLEPLRLFFCGVYYMFLSLEELARRIGRPTVFPQRRYFIRKYMDLQPLVGSAIADEVERQFVDRAKFYFDMAEHFRRP